MYINLIKTNCIYAGSLRRLDTNPTVGEVTSLMSSLAENEQGKSNKVSVTLQPMFNLFFFIRHSRNESV